MTTPAVLAPDDLLARRLMSMGLRGPGFSSPGGVVGHLLAVQAQEFQPSLWGISERTDGRPDAVAMKSAFNAGEFVRTHVMRPTWHVVRPEDLRWLLALTGPRVHQGNRHYETRFEVDDRFGNANDLLADEVSTGPRTRAELSQALAAAGMAAAGPQLGYVLMRAELDAVVVSGPLRGKQHTYLPFDARVPAGYGPLGESFDTDAALAELVSRYLSSRVAATVRDMSWWSGLTVRQIRHGLGLLEGRVRSESGTGVLEGRQLWTLADTEPEAAPRGGPAQSVNGRPAGSAEGAPRATLDFLQAYDELFVSFTDSRGIVFDPAAPVATRPNGAIHSIASNGKIAGRWRWNLGANKISLDIDWYRSPTREESLELDYRIDDISRYWNIPLGSPS